MKMLLWTIIAGLIVLFFAGDKVRGYFKGEPIAEASDAGRDKVSKENARPPAGKAEADQRSTSGPYAPSPADAPELYDSPTRRLGF